MIKIHSECEVRVVTFRAQRPAGGVGTGLGVERGAQRTPFTGSGSQHGSKRHAGSEAGASEPGSGPRGARGSQQWCQGSPRATCCGAWPALICHLRLSLREVIVQLVPPPPLSPEGKG